MNFKYKYVKIGQYFRPIIPVTLSNSKKSVDYLALVDSGSDHNIFHSDISSLLGINISKLKRLEFSGIKKDACVEGRMCVLKITINGFFYDSLVIFSDNIASCGYGVLGENGFFDQFKVSFNYKNSTVLIKH